MHRLLVEWLAGSRQIGRTKKCPPKKNNGVGRLSDVAVESD